MGLNKMGKMKLTVRILQVLMLVIGFVMRGLVYFFDDREIYVTFSYENGKIVSHEHDSFLPILYGILILLFLMFFATVILSIILKIKDKNSILLFGSIVISLLLFLPYIFLPSLSKGNYDYPPVNLQLSPMDYEFTDGNHKIVISEQSWMRYGKADIYEVTSDNTAYFIGSFSTDDGGRNRGDYEFDWSKDYVTIYYDNCTGSDQPIESETVYFVKD